MKLVLRLLFSVFCFDAFASDIPFEQLIKENNRAQRGLASEVQKGSGIEHKQKESSSEEQDYSNLRIKISKKVSGKKRAPSSTGRYRIPL